MAQTQFVDRQLPPLEISEDLAAELQVIEERSAQRRKVVVQKIDDYLNNWYISLTKIILRSRLLAFRKMFE